MVHLDSYWGWEGIPQSTSIHILQLLLYQIQKFYHVPYERHLLSLFYLLQVESRIAPVEVFQRGFEESAPCLQQALEGLDLHVEEVGSLHRRVELRERDHRSVVLRFSQLGHPWWWTGLRAGSCTAR